MGDSNPCKNGGECITDGENYKCTCPLMFFGEECQFGCEHPGKFFNVADNVSFSCADRVCKFTCSDKKTPNYQRPVVCFCTSGNCRWYPGKITSPAVISCPASTPSVTEKPITTPTVKTTTTKTTTTKPITTKTTTTTKKPTKPPRRQKQRTT